MMICPQCDYENINHLVFCSMCGAQLSFIKKDEQNNLNFLQTRVGQNENIQIEWWPLQKLHDYFDNLSTFKFIIIMTLFTFFIVFPLIPVLMLLRPYTDILGGKNLIREFASNSKLVILSLILFLIFIVPLVETFIFQFAIIKLIHLLSFLPQKRLISIIVSAFVFGLSHSYSFLYIIYTFLVGLLLAYSFLLYEIKGKHSYRVVVAIHSLRNSISILAAISIIYFT